MPRELTRILYLEDDPIIAEIGQIALQEFDAFDLLHCWSGKEALAAICDFKPDLMLFDVMMPEMDGMQTFAKVQELTGDACPPLVFMTARAQRQDVEEYLAAGAIAVIRKPFDPMKLGGELRRLWSTLPANQVARAS